MKNCRQIISISTILLLLTSTMVWADGNTRVTAAGGKSINFENQRAATRLGPQPEPPGKSFNK